MTQGRLYTGFVVDGHICYPFKRTDSLTHGGCVCVPFLFEAYVTHYYRVNKSLKIRERNSVILTAEKLLITLL